LLTQRQVQGQRQRIDPKLIQANTLLQFSGLELEQAIEQEVLDNPALELEDDNPCSGCELSPLGCSNCHYAEQSEDQSLIHVAEPVFQELAYTFDPGAEPDDDDDFIGRICADVTLQEHLRQQLRNIASGTAYEIGDYLINYINGSGYLECDLTELLLELDASDEEIAEAVSLIQTLDPPGVGARDLRECLLLQLKYLADDGNGSRVAECIVSECWSEMVARKIQIIARRLKMKPEQVKDGLDFIQTKLNPYPAAGFRSPWTCGSTEACNSVRPDIIIHKTLTGYEIEIVANGYPALAINPHYAELYNQVHQRPSRRRMSEDARHIINSVERAEVFINNLNQRRKTLRAITKCIVEHQHGFLATGSRLFLRPLTRAKVAKMLSIHESTVSRATANKYALLPSQELVELDLFFQSAQSAMDVISDLLCAEDGSHRMSDRDIAEKLHERGFIISRRTVAKYRQALRILSSRQRYA